MLQKINKSLTNIGPIENKCPRWTTKIRSFGPPGALISYRTNFFKNWKKLEKKPVHMGCRFSIGPTIKPINVQSKATVKPVNVQSKTTVKPVNVQSKTTVKPINVQSKTTVKPINVQSKATMKSITTQSNPK